MFEVKHSLVGQFMTTENEIPPRNSSIAQYDFMSDVILDELDNHEIGLLLPAQFSRYFFKEDVRKGREDEPIAVNTDFGWSILGPVNELCDTDDIDFDGVNDWCDAGVNALTDVDNVDIDQMIRLMFRFDFIARPLEDFPSQLSHMSMYDEYIFFSFFFLEDK